jgi:hypothetical protein
LAVGYWRLAIGDLINENACLNFENGCWLLAICGWLFDKIALIFESGGYLPELYG